MTLEVEKLKQKIDNLEEQRLDRIEKKIDELAQNQLDMEKELARYSARWGVVFMVGSAIVAALKLFWEDLTGLLR